MEMIRDYLKGYSSNSNILAPTVCKIESGETLAIPRDELKNMSEEEVKEAMFNMFDLMVEEFNLYPDSLESTIFITGFSTLGAHQLVQEWMKKRGI